MKPIGYRHPMKATKGLETRAAHLDGNAGYHARGGFGGYELSVPKTVEGMNFAPFLHGQDIGNLIENFYDTGNKIQRRKKQPYYGGFNQPQLAPGHYPLGKPGPQGYGNQVERANWSNDEPNQYQYPEDLVHSLGLLERQTGEANMPHQWKQPAVEMDQSQRHLAEFFEDLRSKETERKVQDLQAKGYGPEEIKDVIVGMRRREIEKELGRPSVSHMRYEDVRPQVSLAPAQPTHRIPAVQGVPAGITRYTTNNGF